MTIEKDIKNHRWVIYILDEVYVLPFNKDLEGYLKYLRQDIRHRIIDDILDYS